MHTRLKTAEENGLPYGIENSIFGAFILSRLDAWLHMYLNNYPVSNTCITTIILTKIVNCISPKIIGRFVGNLPPSVHLELLPGVCCMYVFEHHKCTISLLRHRFGPESNAPLNFPIYMCIEIGVEYNIFLDH